MSRRRSLRPSLRLEILEDRQVPASSLYASLSSGELYIEGTDSADLIKVTQTSTQIKVDGLSGSFVPSQVQRIRIFGLGGDDTITLNVSGKIVTKPAQVFGGGDDDCIIGGNGSDYLDGGTGADVVEGRAGNDFVAGDSGNDNLNGGNGNDKVIGGTGTDFLYGGAGTDTLCGGTGTDTLQGGSGSDTIYDSGSTSLVSDSSHTRYYQHSSYGWADSQLDDAILRRYVRLSMSDTSITRDEMLNILRKAGKDGVTDDEFGDLQLLTASPTPVMPNYVRVLAKKVVNPDAANAWWTAGDGTRVALGSLEPGSPELQMTRLTDKWFMGADRPMAKNVEKTLDYGYQLAQGSLFKNGVSELDVNQGSVGDCYLLAALAATAKQSPSMITNMFIDNGDGTYTVKLHTTSGTVDYVTVDKYLPQNDDGEFVFANAGDSLSSAGNELWVALAEKAYAQLNESGGINQDGTNSYNGIGDADDLSDGINTGASGLALTHVTGLSATIEYIPTVNAGILQNALTTGRKVTFSSLTTPGHPDIVGDHAYALVGYDAKTQKFRLLNPHGAGANKPHLVNLKLSEFVGSFSQWAITST